MAHLKNKNVHPNFLSRPLFIYFRLFFNQLTVNNCSITAADDWIGTWVLWYRSNRAVNCAQSLPTHFQTLGVK